MQVIFTALERAFKANSIPIQTLNPWYFPSIGEYATLLEQQGFDIIHAMSFYSEFLFLP